MELQVYMEQKSMVISRMPNMEFWVNDTLIIYEIGEYND